MKILFPPDMQQIMFRKIAGLAQTAPQENFFDKHKSQDCQTIGSCKQIFENVKNRLEPGGEHDS